MASQNDPYQLSLQDQTTKFLLYTAPGGQVKVEVLLSNETIWLTQERISRSHAPAWECIPESANG